MRKHVNKLLIILFIALPITAYGATYTLTSASYPININGQKLSVEPLNLNGTTYLPLRSISEAVGVPIEWNSAKKSVEINTVDVEALKKACVMIFADDGKTQVQGSGVVTDYGEVTSALHGISDGRTNVRTSEGYKLTVSETSQSLDIMTLNADKEIKPVKIGDSDEVKVGDKVIVIGSPDGKEDTVIFATVKKLTNEIVISTSLDGGGSGSGVFDVSGNLIGIVVARDRGLDETYVTPINAIRKAL